MKKKEPVSLPAPPETIEVHVTEEHIYKGERWKLYTNPIALAMEDQPYKMVSVGYLLAYVDGHEYKLDEDTRAWMNAFLHKEPVKPFKARLKRGISDKVFGSGHKGSYTHL